jgi:hypothetical protein
MKADYEVFYSKIYPILWRKEGAELTDTCMFCGKRHTHAKSEGHRNPHCRNVIDYKGNVISRLQGVILSNGTLALPSDGYIIREY